VARFAACQLWLRRAVRRVGLVGQFRRARSSPQFGRSVTRAGVSPNLSGKCSSGLHLPGTAEVGPSANLALVLVLPLYRHAWGAQEGGAWRERRPLTHNNCA